jgi:1,5-anhydro-D-fructose reductase (1,5-anhydro-D-mannitol-forming)
MPIGFGFIGASTIAHEHMVAAVRDAGHEVVSVCSGSAERARGFAADHDIGHATADLAELLGHPGVQAVYVSSTNERHAEQVRAVAAAGKHVLCEKPLALSLNEARAMVSTCSNAGVLLATNHHLRNAATHRKLRELVQGGAVGPVLFARINHGVYLRPIVQGWRINNPSAGGGVILDIVVHDVDALRFVLGAEPLEATAMKQSAFLAREGLEDGVMAVLRLQGGVLAHVYAAYTARHDVTGFEIIGEQGALWAKDMMTTRAAGSIVLRDARGEREVPVEHENLYTRGVALFCAAMAGQGEPAATGLDGLRSLAGALAVAEAARSGHSVTIAPEPADSIAPGMPPGITTFPSNRQQETTT